MRDPAEMLLTNYFEPSLSEWARIFFKRRDVTLFHLVPPKAVAEIAPKQWEPIVHIDNSANPARSKL
jgi:hypothetical protein